jgi:hypothetical protein
MSSIDAKNVAKEVLETVGKGKKVNLGKIIKKNGYSKNTADSPKQVTNTKSYKEIMEPVVKRWIRIRDNLTSELEGRNLTKERYETIIKAIDYLTKNIQLLSGKETEITTVIIEDQDKITNAVRNITTRDNRGSNSQGN